MAKQYITIKIKKSGNPIANIIRDITNSWFEFQADVAELGERTSNKMKEKIKMGKKKSQAGEPERLESAIDSKLFVNVGGQIPHVGFGVGNIIKLKKEAPHYNAVNYGSNHMVGKRVPMGKFSPGEPKPIIGGGKGRWKSGEGNYSFVVKNPIRPINYIEKTWHWLGGQISKLLAKHTRRLKKK